MVAHFTTASQLLDMYFHYDTENSQPQIISEYKTMKSENNLIICLSWYCQLICIQLIN